VIPRTYRPSRSTPPYSSHRSGVLVPTALAALDEGGTLAIAGIYLTDIPVLNYERHLFQERTLRSVKPIRAKTVSSSSRSPRRYPFRVTTTAYPLEEADRALADLAHDRVNGAAVLINTRLAGVDGAVDQAREALTKWCGPIAHPGQEGSRKRNRTINRFAR